jgi:hypothetical protein
LESNKINTSYSKIGDSNTFLQEEAHDMSSPHKKEEICNITAEREQPDNRENMMDSDMIFSIQQNRQGVKVRGHFDNDMNNKISSFKSVRRMDKLINDSQTNGSRES